MVYVRKGEFFFHHLLFNIFKYHSIFLPVLRGHALDYERWANEVGDDNWDYKHLLPYFKRAQKFHGDRKGYFYIWLKFPFDCNTND